MKRLLLIISIMCACACEGCLAAYGQDDSIPRKKVPLLERPFFSKGIIGRAIRAFSDIDSSYCAPPHYNWSTMISADAQVQPYALHTPEATLRMAPPSQVSFAPHFGWRWIVGGVAVVKLPKNGFQTTNHLSFYARPLGGDLIYQYNKIGAFKQGGLDVPKSFSTLITGHFYYIFNHRRFNYSTQQAQGSPQLRSAGSWLLGFRYDHQNVVFQEQRHLYHSLGPTGGYAYNWVLAPGWVLGGSLQGGTGVTMWRENRLAGNLHTSAFSCNAIARLGLMWTDGQWFAGANAVSHNYIYTRSHNTMTNSLNYFSLYAGVKFGLRKKYRKREE